MTDEEKAIVMAHTGICMLTEDKFHIFHEYVEKLMGRPVYTHELYSLADEIKERSKGDFIKLCKDETVSGKITELMDLDEIVDLIKENEETNSKEKTFNEIIDTMNEEQKTAMYAIVGQALEDAKNKSSWIPISKRLPEEGESAIVWYRYWRYGDYNDWYYTYGIGYQFDGNWSIIDGGNLVTVYAWMQPPAPYEVESEDEK